MLRELRRHPKRATPHWQTRQMWTQYDQSCGNCRRLLNNREGSQSATCKKNAEANTRAHDLNQKTMQALDTLAEEYEIFEEPMKKVTFETEEGDMSSAVASDVEKSSRGF